ncbi:MAG TPA: glycoside hydrolase family 97 catalytic domain-containing protein [Gammaproteobacteria bacterium]
MMSLPNKIVVIALLFLAPVAAMFLYQPDYEVRSPDGRIVVRLETKDPAGNTGEMGQLYYRVSYVSGEDNVTVIGPSRLGLETSHGAFSEKLVLSGASNAVPIRADYPMLHGKKRRGDNQGNERVFHLKNPEGQKVHVLIRVYNDGIAFRYMLPGTAGQVQLLKSELSTFSIPEGGKRWMQLYRMDYEGFYELNTDGRGKSGGSTWAYPALFEINDGLFALVTEADNDAESSATRLTNNHDGDTYHVTLPPPRDDFQQDGTRIELPWLSPWRVVMIGSLSNIVESTLVTDVSRPSKIGQTDWIQPGAAAWIYWAHNHGSKDYQTVTEYVDLAVEMQWPYVLIDWEWNIMSNGGTVEDVVRYANEKGVKPLIWYNSGTSWLDPQPVDRIKDREDRAKEFAWLNEIGVYGIKVDFFAGDQQDMMKFYLDLLQDAADHRLMVNFHGATIPRGWSRTYPNLMTVEAVYGAEWYNNAAILTKHAAEHNATLPFTRNVIGPMDYTPVTFSDSQHPHTTSYGHELALSVLFESGIQHFADRPSVYRNLIPAAKEFLKHVPVRWDDTRLIGGYPGRDVVMARKNGDTWYIGGINGLKKSQDLAVDFSFLESGAYHLKLIKDGKTARSFATVIKEVSNDSTITVSCLPEGGFAGILERRH